ncbi:MAG TPA: hypothetical protein VK927_07475, partial [Adhaeribacter sp.]|nr:hypothetical protein [Adhaeribacter sp.]
EETNVKLVVELLKVQLEAIYYSDLLTKNNLTLNEVFHTVIFTFMRGIATPEGLKVISAYKPE